ncbi:MAG: AAA family ATPase, partial [Thermoanaerobaculia bacterium]
APGVRPLRLQLEGFTCFRDRQDPLELEGLDLFAISGATGAGKSSLLDAMIFALFGRVPRMGKVGLAELISLGRDRMAVVLDFRLGDKTYRVTRSAHRTRASQALLDELRGELEQPLAEGVKAVDEEVRNLLGFDYDTFTRAVILPQGEFAAFLKGRPGEQQKILRDLLRLHVFETMRRLAGEERRRLETTLSSHQRRIDEDFADATPEELDKQRRQAEELERKLAGTEETLRELRATVDERRRELARVRGLLEPRDKARQRARELSTKKEGETATLRTLEDRRKNLAGRAEKLTRDLTHARTALEAIGYDSELDALLDGVREAASSLGDVRGALQRQANHAAELATEHRRLDAEAEKQREAETRAEERAQAAENRRRDREAALREAEHENHVVLLRRELAPGEACPVCEQTVAEQPTLPEVPELDFLGRELATARRTQEKARRELDAARGAVASTGARAEALQQQIEITEQRTKELVSAVTEAETTLEARVGEKLLSDLPRARRRCFGATDGPQPTLHPRLRRWRLPGPRSRQRRSAAQHRHLERRRDLPGLGVPRLGAQRADPARGGGGVVGLDLHRRRLRQPRPRDLGDRDRGDRVAAHRRPHGGHHHPHPRAHPAAAVPDLGREVADRLPLRVEEG